MGNLTPIVQGVTSVGGGVIGMIGQRKRDERAMMNQRQLMDIQFKNQQRLNEQGHELQKKMWEHTNYKNQMKMIEEAGLNPALLYGMQGGGGVTVGSQTGGNAAAGQAPQPQHMDISSIVQANNLAADVALKKALADKAQAEADKTRGVDTQQAETSVQKMLAEIKSQEAQQALMKAHTEGQEISNLIQGESMEEQIQTLKYTAKRIEYEAGKAKNDKSVSDATVNDAISKIKAETAIKWLETNLIKADTKLSQEQAKKAAAEIVNMQSKLGLDIRMTDAKEREVKAKEFETFIKANYPTVWEAFGHSVMTGINMINGGETYKFEKP